MIVLRICIRNPWQPVYRLAYLKGVQSEPPNDLTKSPGD